MTCIVCLIISLIQKVNCIIQNFQPFASLSFSWFTCNQKSPLIEEKPKTMRLLIKMIVGPQLHGMMKQQQKRGSDDDDTNQVTWLSFTVIFFCLFTSCVNSFPPHKWHNHTLFIHEGNAIIGRIGCTKIPTTDKKTKENSTEIQKERGICFSI